MKLPYRLLLIITLLFFRLLSISSLTIEKKLDINKTLQDAHKYIKYGEYDRAEIMLIQLKKSYPATEFVCMANYYLALSKFSQDLGYEALYFIKLALEEKEKYTLSTYYIEQIPFLAGSIYYTLGLRDDALTYFTSCIDNNFSDPVKQQSYLKLCQIYYKKKHIPKSLFYYSKIERSRLPAQLIKQYRMITAFLLWDKIDTTAMGYADPNVSCLAVDRDTLYIGMWNGGLIQYNYLTGEYSFFARPAIGSDEVRSIYVDRSRYIYIGTMAGISVFDKRNGVLTELDAFKKIKVTAICGNESSLFIGTLGDGVLVYDKKNGTVSPLQQHLVSSISCLYYTDDTLLIGTYSARMYSYTEGTLKRLTGRKAPFKPVTAITAFKGKYWLSTHGQGLYSYDPEEKRFSRYSFEDNNFFLSITASETTLYAGSFGKGIFRYTPEQDSWSLYEISDLYINRDIQAITISDGIMFIATLGEGVLIRKQVK